MTLLGLSKTTANEANLGDEVKSSKEKTGFRRRDRPAEHAEWKPGEVIRKQSRVDEDKFQAFVLDEADGKPEDLASAALTISKHCKYTAEDPTRTAAAEDFLQFVRWFSNEQSCRTANGP